MSAIVGIGCASISAANRSATTNVKSEGARLGRVALQQQAVVARGRGGAQREERAQAGQIDESLLLE